MRLSRRGIRQRADFVGAHRVLTAARRHGRQDDVAKSRAGAFAARSPNISLALDRKPMPIRQDADREHYLEGPFGRAGLAYRALAKMPKFVEAGPTGGGSFGFFLP